MKWWRGLALWLRSGEGGFILPLVLVFMALGLLFLTPTLGHAFTSLQANRETNLRADELHAADSGLEEGIYWLLHLRPGSEYVWNEDISSYERVSPYTLNDMAVSVTIEPILAEGNTYKITSVAQRSDGTLSTVLAKAYVMPVITIAEGEDPYVIDDYFPGDLAVDGDLNLETANAEIDGDVFVSGNLDMGQGSLIVGDVLVEGDVTLGQSANIQCEVLCLTGNLDLGQSASTDPPTELDSEIHFIGGGPFQLNFANSAYVTGNIYADGPLTITLGQPQVFIHGDIIVDGDLSITINSPSGEITGTLYATGENVLIHLEKKANGIFKPPYDPDNDQPADLYHDEDYPPVMTGAGDATYPIPVPCADFESECPLPEPDKDCPVFPDSEGKVLSWEIS